MARARSRSRRTRRSNPRGYIRYRGRFVSAKPRRRRRRNPLWRARRSGRYKGRAPGRRLHRIRGGVGWHNNPPKRRRRRSRRANPFIRTHRRRGSRVRRYFRRRNNPVRRRHSRRRSRRNPAVATRRFRRGTRLLSNPFQAVMDVVKDAFSKPTLETMLHTGVGFGGALVVSKLASKGVLNITTDSTTDKVARVATTFGGTILTSLLGGMVVGPTAGARMVIGGLLATLWQGVTEIVKGTAAGDFVPTLGQAVDEDFRKAVETEVLRSLRRGGGGMHAYLQPAGSERYLTPAGSAAYFTPRGAGMQAFATENGIIDAGVSGEFGRDNGIEQF